jgi:hypothetical protein
VIIANVPEPTHPEQGDALDHLAAYDPDEPVIVAHHAARTAKDVLGWLARSVRRGHLSDADVELLGMAIATPDPRDWEIAGATGTGTYPQDRAGIAARGDGGIRSKEDHQQVVPADDVDQPTIVGNDGQPVDPAPFHELGGLLQRRAGSDRHAGLLIMSSAVAPLAAAGACCRCGLSSRGSAETSSARATPCSRSASDTTPSTDP